MVSGVISLIILDFNIPKASISNDLDSPPNLLILFQLMTVSLPFFWKSTDIMSSSKFWVLSCKSSPHRGTASVCSIEFSDYIQREDSYIGSLTNIQGPFDQTKEEEEDLSANRCYIRIYHLKTWLLKLSSFHLRRQYSLGPNLLLNRISLDPCSPRFSIIFDPLRMKLRFYLQLLSI